MTGNSNLRYSADEAPPPLLSFMLSAQTVLLIVAGVVLTPAIVMRSAGMPEADIPQVIFLALVVSGVITILQALRYRRIGAGYILLMGTSGAFIAAGIAALQFGGLPLLMILIVVSSSVQFFVAAHLSLFRRIVTPVVGGTTLMLLAVTVMPVAFNHFQQSPSADAVLVALATLLPVVLLTFYGRSSVKLWAPIIGIMTGSTCHWLLGGYFEPLENSVWVGAPSLHWPGLDLSFNSHFWLLLPTFVIVTIVGALETYGDAIAIQKISSRKARATDYRVVQGAMNADGLGNLFAGLTGTLPCTTYSTSISVVDMTGVASRRVGWICGLLLVLFAFVPVFYGLILALPDAVVGTYLLVLIVMLFVHGLRMVVTDKLDLQQGLIVSLSFWLGAGFQQRAIFPEHIPAWLTPITDNGMTVGTLSLLLFVLLSRLRPQKRKTVQTTFDAAALNTLLPFIAEYGRQHKWSQSLIHRTQLAAEETLLCLLALHQDDNLTNSKLRAELRYSSENLELDLAVSNTPENIEDLLVDAAQTGNQSHQHLPYKVLDSITSDVAHLQYNNLDYVCLKMS